MKCQRFRNQLDEYLDNEIDPAIQKSMMDHEAECETCRLQVQRRQRIFHAMTSHDDFADFEDLSDTVMNRIRELPTLNQPNPLHKPLMLALAIALLVSGTLILIAYRSLPGPVNPVDLLRLITASVQLPEGMQTSLNELLSFLNVCWIIFRSLTQLIVQLAMILLFRTAVTIPVLVFMTSGVFFVLWRYRKYRKQTFSVGLLF